VFSCTTTRTALWPRPSDPVAKFYDDARTKPRAHGELLTDEIAKAELSDACYRAGCSAFPSVVWGPAEFAQACLERWAAESADRVAERLGSAHGPAEEYLVAACLAGRPGAVEALEREYISKLTGRIRVVCGSQDLVDDALQALREKLLLPPEPRLALY
jgi:hypothetical protein